MKCCVVIPIYNECETIGFIVDSLRRKGFDVYVVNDGSTDESEIIAQDRGAVVISSEHKTGKGASLVRGFDHVRDLGYDGVIAMDGDGQHDIEDIDKILRLAESQPRAIVNGTRMFNAKGMPFVRFMTNKFMSWLISWACGQKISDTQCGFRYISMEILRNIDLCSTGYEIETELLMKACRKQYPVLSVPVRTIYSSEKSKVRPVRDTIRFFRFFFQEVFRK